MGCLKINYNYNTDLKISTVNNYVRSEKTTLKVRSSYLFGFNGKELDKSGEWGSLTHYDYGFRIYNPSIGKFLSVDPLTRGYPELTPYQFASNTPIQAIDLDGLEGASANNIVVESTGKNKFKVTGSLEIQFKILNLSKEDDYLIESSRTLTRSDDKIEFELKEPASRSIKDHSRNGKGVEKEITFNLKVENKFEKISSTSEIKSNDFLVVVVDNLDDNFLDKFGKYHNTGAHVVNGAVAFVPSKYFHSDKSKLLPHEFFHLLGLDDMEDQKDKNNLMFHLEGQVGFVINQTQVFDVIFYLLGYKKQDELKKSSHHENQKTNVIETLKNELKKSSTYKFDEKKAKKANANG